MHERDENEFWIDELIFEAPLIHMFPTREGLPDDEDTRQVESEFSSMCTGR
jgi:hypothetical protein